MSYGLPSEIPSPLDLRLGKAQAELDILYQFGAAIHVPRDWNILFRALYAQAERLIPIDAAYIALLNQDNTRLQTVISIDEGIEYPPDPPRLINDSSPSGWVALHAAPLIFKDLNAELPIRFPALPVRADLGDTTKLSRGWMTVPMLINREAKGIINVQSYQYGVYGEREERLLVTLGSMLAIGLHQAQLLQQFEAMRAALSAPLIPVSAQITILPLIGELDEARMSLVQRILLTTIELQGIRHVIIDLTGVTEVAPEAQRRLLRLVQAVALLGATCTLSGLRAELARSFGANQIDLATLVVVRDVEQALIQVASLPRSKRQ